MGQCALGLGFLGVAEGVRPPVFFQHHSPEAAVTTWGLEFELSVSWLEGPTIRMDTSAVSASSCSDGLEAVLSETSLSLSSASPLRGRHW